MYQDTCPNCGYCKHCGRGANPYQQPYKHPYLNPIPWWQNPQPTFQTTSGTAIETAIDYTIKTPSTSALTQYSKLHQGDKQTNPLNPNNKTSR